MMAIKLQQLRHSLHQAPELSGAETHTAATVAAVLSTYGPDELRTGIAGCGVLARFAGAQPGPRVMLRCELDAVPIHETNDFEDSSMHDCISHKCGHDGHMAILLETARRLCEQRPESGEVMLLFQPAEETGVGAAAVREDPVFQEFKPDYVFALHNIPGYALGTVVVREHAMCCASRGLIICMEGVAPTAIVVELIDFFQQIQDRYAKPEDEVVLLTLVGTSIGNRTFGNTPKHAEIFVTLRSQDNATLDSIDEEVRARARELCEQRGIACRFEVDDEFPATRNAPEAVEFIRQACKNNAVECIEPPQPIRWSEDFGHFTELATGALFALGAGEDDAKLHESHYDFPDELIDRGADMFLAIIEQVQQAT
jgi:amidohydrolase